MGLRGKILANQVAVITGASRGIGASIALQFAESGADIAFTYLRAEEKAKEIEQLLLAKGVRAKAYQFDAKHINTYQGFVNQVVKDFGSVNICVNNAGVTKDRLLLRLPAEEWEDVIHTNLSSVYAMTKQVITPMLRTKKGGAIINISSIIGIKGQAGQSSYAASKAGIIGFSKAVARELASRQIRCNVVAPGFIDTDMTSYLKANQNVAESFLSQIPLKRLGHPEDVARACLFLASDWGSYITGQVLSVCGGLNI